jgi:hypothetical protein
LKPFARDQTIPKSSRLRTSQFKEAAVNKSQKLFLASAFHQILAGNNVSVTFLEKMLVTTTGSGKF